VIVCVVSVQDVDGLNIAHPKNKNKKDLFTRDNACVSCLLIFIFLFIFSAAEHEWVSREGPVCLFFFLKVVFTF